MIARGFVYSVVGGRALNQDAFLCLDPAAFYAVADGVGGGAMGEVASALAVETLQKNLSEGHGMKAGFDRAHECIYKRAMDTFGSAIMGTTLTAIQIVDGVAVLCHIGDSRCYRVSINSLSQLTVDQEFLDDETGNSILESYLGKNPDLGPLDIMEQRIPVASEDKFLLCSDGLYKQLSESKTLEIIQKNKNQPEKIPVALADEAVLADSSDNVTVLYVTIGGMHE